MYKINCSFFSKFSSKSCQRIAQGRYILIAFACVFAVSILLVIAGCAGSVGQLSQSFDAQSATASVKSADGNTFEVSLSASMGGQSAQGGMQGGSQPPDMQSGQGGPGNNNSSDESNNSSGKSSVPAKPDGQSSDFSNEPPSKPDGDSSDSGSTPPSKPDGDKQSGNGSDSKGQPQGGMGQMPGAQNSVDCILTITNVNAIQKSDGSQASLSDITSGTKLQIDISNGTQVTSIKIGGSSSSKSASGSGNVNNGSAATTISNNTNKSSESFSSSNQDENAVRVQDSAEASLENCNFEKTGDSSSSEDSDFYGLNAVTYVWNKAKAIITGGKITSNSSGSNGLFCYGEGSTAQISDTVIRTSKGNSGGIEVAGGGTINAKNLDIETQGGSCAAIRSDRGGGTENVDGGSYKCHGQGSPAIYCTANVNVSNAYMESEVSEVNIIEGKNSINLDNCILNCNTQGKYHRGDCVRNVMLYQSMSGDAEQGTCNYSAKNSKYTANHGNMFYITNTSAIVNLENCLFEGTHEAFMKVAGNSENWGKSGSNGGHVQLNCKNQKLNGPIVVDDISELTMSLAEGSAFSGSINESGSSGTVKLSLDQNSTFTLTGDTYVTTLDGNTSGINLNGHKLFVNGQQWG